MSKDIKIVINEFIENLTDINNSDDANVSERDNYFCTCFILMSALLLKLNERIENLEQQLSHKEN